MSRAIDLFNISLSCLCIGDFWSIAHASYHEKAYTIDSIKRKNTQQEQIVQFQTWQQGSSNPENPNNFAAIKEWFASLNGKEITWRQRLIPPTADVSEIDWEPQRFDEKFVITTPEIRGLTLYWRKPNTPEERNTTPHKLELDNLRGQLFVHPQSQKNVVIRIGLPEVIYQKILMANPLVASSHNGEIFVLSLRDEKQLIEVKIALTPEKINQLKQQLP